MKRLIGLLVGGLALCAAALVASQASDAGFPHETHERLFPVCEGCHLGVVSGAIDELYPEPLDCARCHDGERVERVEWQPPSGRESSLRFHHRVHEEAIAGTGDGATCQTCHAAGERPTRMSVGTAQPAACLACHAPSGDEHLASSADCSLCHLPLAEAAGLSTQQVAHFPRPPSHDAAEFLSSHAPDSPLREVACGVCHARETCERCHANADRLPQVMALARDARVANLEAGRAAEYPVPASHLERAWGAVHGIAARAEPFGCSNCHTRPSCAECHREASGAVASIIGSLPAPARGRAPGVALAGAGRNAHPPDFGTRHGSWAATGSLECAQCHSQQYCSACHTGADSHEFHPSNFTERHAMEVFAGGGDCQSCHNTETFCRSCHTGAGLAPAGRMSAAFHTAQPLWVLSHGQAARMGMESCASCHRQGDCLQCHSAAGGWGVNPHGPGFAANRLGARNQATCRWCHLGDGMGRN